MSGDNLEKKYASCGKLRYRVDTCDCNKRCIRQYIYFTPDADHYIKHDGKEYAVFVSEGRQHCERYSLILCGKEHLIYIEKKFADALARTAASSACKSINVCITVQQKSVNTRTEDESGCESKCCKKRKSNLLLVGITVSAK